MAGPEIPAGSVGKSTKALAEMVDFYPTLAEWCGLKAPAYVSGVSQMPVLKNPQMKQPPRAGALTQYADGYSLRTDRYRYTEWGENGKGGNELYDHNSDPAEMKNLAGKEEQAAVVKDLSGQLHKRIVEAQRKPDGLMQIQFENRRRVK